MKSSPSSNVVDPFVTIFDEFAVASLYSLWLFSFICPLFFGVEVEGTLVVGVISLVAAESCGSRRRCVPRLRFRGSASDGPELSGVFSADISDRIDAAKWAGVFAYRLKIIYLFLIGLVRWCDLHDLFGCVDLCPVLDFSTINI